MLNSRSTTALTLSTLILAVSAKSLRSRAELNSICRTSYNATGNLTFPGLLPRSNDGQGAGAANWTLSTGVWQHKAPQDPNITLSYQHFFLEASSPSQNLSAESSFVVCPYELIFADQNATWKATTSYVDSCSGLISSDCHDSIVSTIRANAQQAANTFPANGNTTTSQLLCKNYLMNALSQAITSKACKGTFTGWQGGTPLDRLSNLYQNSSVPVCTKFASTQPPNNTYLFQTGVRRDVGAEVFTEYDRMVTTPNAILFAAFLKNGSGLTLDAKWGNATMGCLAADNIAAGSRVVKSLGSQKMTSAWNLGLVGTVLVGFMMVL